MRLAVALVWCGAGLAACGEPRRGCGEGVACGAARQEACGAAGHYGPSEGVAPPCLMSTSARAASVNSLLTSLYSRVRTLPSVVGGLRTAFTGGLRRASHRIQGALGGFRGRHAQTSLADIFQHLKNIVVKYEETKKADGYLSLAEEENPTREETSRQTIVPTLSVLFSNFILSNLQSGEGMVMWGATGMVLTIYTALAAVYFLGREFFPSPSIDRKDRVTDHLDHITSLLDRFTNGY